MRTARRWPSPWLRRPRFYLRAALVGAFLSVFATVSLASGGILPSPAEAPGMAAPLIIDEPSPPSPAVASASVSPAVLATPAPNIPSQEFISEMARVARSNPAKGTLSEHTVAAYALLAGWPPELITDLLDVAWCESRYNPAATNGYMRGLMQVNTIWFDYSEIDRDQWADPLVNLRVARTAYLYDIARGYAPWTQWECKPGGSVVAASTGGGAAVNPVAEGAVTPAAEESPSPAAQEPASPTVTPTLAPWDSKPSWPPKYDRADDTRGAAATPTPAP